MLVDDFPECLQVALGRVGVLVFLDARDAGHAEGEEEGYEAWLHVVSVVSVVAKLRIFSFSSFISVSFLYFCGNNSS